MSSLPRPPIYESYQEPIGLPLPSAFRASGAFLIVRPSARPLEAPLTARVSKAKGDAICLGHHVIEPAKLY